MARIRVRLRDGRTGTIDESEFDAKSMEKIGGVEATLEQPTPERPGLTTRIGTGAIDLLKGILQPVARFGRGLGEAAGGISPAAQAQQQSRQALQGQIGKLLQKSAELRKQGKKKEAQRLSRLAKEQAEFLQEGTAKDIREVKKGKEELVKGAVGTGAFFVPGGKTATSRILASTLAGGGFGLGVSKKGEELPAAAGGAVIGGAFGIGAELLGKAGAALKTRRLQKAGPKVTITGSKLKADPFFRTGKEALEETAGQIGLTDKLSSTQKVEVIESAWNSSQSRINDLLQDAAPVADDVVNKNLLKHYRNSNIDATKPATKKLLDLTVGKLNQASGNNLAFNQLKSTARGEMGNAFSKGGENLTAKQEVWTMIYKTIKDSLDNVSPQIRTINNQQNKLFGLAAEFVPAAKKATEQVAIRAPLTTAQIPTGVTKEAVQRGAGGVRGALSSILGLPGRGVEAIGGAAAGIPQVGRNVLINQLLRGGQLPAPTREPTAPAVSAPPTAPTTPTAEPRQAITAEMAAMAQIALSPKEAKKISDAYKLQQSAAGVKESAAIRQRKDLARSGLRGLDEAEKLFKEDPSILVKRAGTLGLLTRRYDAAIFRAVEGLLRARSGAAVPEQEVRRYVNQFAPRLGDSKKTALFKLEELRKDLQDPFRINSNIVVPEEQF